MLLRDPPLPSRTTPRIETLYTDKAAPMASAARPPFSFSFPHLPTLPPTKLSKTLLPNPYKPFPTLSLRTPRSFNVSQEEPPLSEEEETSVDPRRLEEKFVVLNTGIYECRSCGHLHDEAAGDPSYPIPPGLSFDKLPADWRCPTCGAAKSFFQSKSIEIAGFAQNQQFGLGANTLTSGQKALVIYGSLLLFFALFLSGYFLQ